MDGWWMMTLRTVLVTSTACRVVAVMGHLGSTQVAGSLVDALPMVVAQHSDAIYRQL